MGRGVAVPSYECDKRVNPSITIYCIVPSSLQHADQMRNSFGYHQYLYVRPINCNYFLFSVVKVLSRRKVSPNGKEPRSITRWSYRYTNYANSKKLSISEFTMNLMNIVVSKKRTYLSITKKSSFSLASSHQNSLNYHLVRFKLRILRIV